jgi:hypothetical protein
LILYTGSFVSGLIVEMLSHESFLVVVSNVVKDLVDGNQEGMNVLAVIGTVVEDLVNGGQEDANEWFECNNGNVVTSIAVTFGDKKFNQEDAIELGNSNNADDLTCSNFSHLLLPFSSIFFFGIKGFLFMCYLCCLFTCFWYDAIIFLWVCA